MEILKEASTLELNGRGDLKVVSFIFHLEVAKRTTLCLQNSRFDFTLLGTAFTIFAPARMIPLHSASLPTIKPFTSCMKTSGMRFWLQSRMKRAAFSADSV